MLAESEKDNKDSWLTTAFLAYFYVWYRENEKNLEKFLKLEYPDTRKSLRMILTSM